MPAGSRAPSAFLGLPGAVPGQLHHGGQVAAHYGTPAAEQRAWLEGHAIADLSHLAIVRVPGPDRLTWLDSLASQRLSGLCPGESAEALILDPAGHIEHAFGITDDGEAAYLVTGPDSGEALASYLDSLRFRKRVEVALARDLAAIGHPGPAPAGALAWRDPWPGITPGGTRLGPPGDAHPGREWRLTIELVPHALLGARAGATMGPGAGYRAAGTDALEALRIAAWRPSLEREAAAPGGGPGALPAELDWLRTAVHLDKGCYRGQESVAKIHNAGRPPRRLVFLDLDGSGGLLPQPGAELKQDGLAIGHLTSVARHVTDGPIALALIKRAAPADSRLSVTGPAGEQIAARASAIVPISGEDADRPQIVRPPRRRGPALPMRRA